MNILAVNLIKLFLEFFKIKLLVCPFYHDGLILVPVLLFMCQFLGQAWSTRNGLLNIVDCWICLPTQCLQQSWIMMFHKLEFVLYFSFFRNSTNRFFWKRSLNIHRKFLLWKQSIVGTFDSMIMKGKDIWCCFLTWKWQRTLCVIKEVQKWTGRKTVLQVKYLKRASCPILLKCLEKKVLHMYYYIIM